MSLNNTNSLKAWIRTLPASKISRPETFVGYVKYVFWRFYTPFHPKVRDTLVTLGLVKHKGRQDFLLGYIADHLSPKEFISHLVSKGFGNHFIAWKDEGELVGLRYVDNFKTQYHLRVFHDGEVRGHYEYTPECHPFWHIREVGMEDRRSHFMNFLSDILVQTRGNYNN